MDKLEAALRLRGVWTMEDLSHRPNSLIRAVEEVTGIMGALAAVARKYAEE